MRTCNKCQRRPALEDRYACRECENARRRADRKRRRAPVEREHVPMVPAAPFVGWVNQRLAGVDSDGYPMNKNKLSALMGVTPDRLTQVMGQKNVGLDFVDRTLCMFGEPEMLDVLYPVIEQWDRAAA